MLYLFRSKNYRKASSLLQTLGMFSPDFRGFQIQQIGANLKACESLLPSMLQVMQEIKLSPLKALKVALFCLQIIHFSKDKKVYQLIFEFLRQLQQRVLALLGAKKGIKGTLNTVQVLNSSKEFLDRSGEMVQIDFSSIMLEKIVIPLICFQQKLIACCQLVYDRERTRVINEAQTWSFVNSMRKITDIGPDIQSLGRYYFKESVSSVISLMKVIHFDIQLLYKRIMDYIRKKIAVIQVLMEEQKMKMELIIERQQLYEFLMMIDELQLINQKLRVLYNGRYFIFHLANAFIYLPVLFTPDQNIDLIYKIKQHHKQQGRKNKSLQLQRWSKQRAPTDQKVQHI